MASDARTKLVSAAMRLMLRQGYTATGIDSICREAGLSKGAFYHSFQSKEEVALAALDTFYQHGLEALRSIDVSDVPPAERLPRFVERLADRANVLWEHGCLIGGLATEMAAASDTLQRQVALRFDELAALLEPLAEPYAASLAMPRMKATAIAEDLLAFVEGAVVLARGHRNPRLLRPSLRRYAALLRAAAATRSLSPASSFQA
jgi:TetR/AcrR family transcriptional repressor of nem operon